MRVSLVLPEYCICLAKICTKHHMRSMNASLTVNVYLFKMIKMLIHKAFLRCLVFLYLFLENIPYTVHVKFIPLFFNCLYCLISEEIKGDVGSHR